MIADESEATREPSFNYPLRIDQSRRYFDRPTVDQKAATSKAGCPANGLYNDAERQVTSTKYGTARKANTMQSRTTAGTAK